MVGLVVMVVVVVAGGVALLYMESYIDMINAL